MEIDEPVPRELTHEELAAQAALLWGQPMETEVEKVDVIPETHETLPILEKQSAPVYTHSDDSSV